MERVNVNIFKEDLLNLKSSVLLSIYDELNKLGNKSILFNNIDKDNLSKLYIDSESNDVYFEYMGVKQKGSDQSIEHLINLYEMLTER